MNLTKKNTKSYSAEHLYNESWLVSDYFITVNGNVINPDWYVDYDIKYTGQDISGSISFKDPDDIKKKGNIEIGGIVEVSFTSQPGSKAQPEAYTEQKFLITKVSVDTSDVPIVHLKIKDTIGAGLDSTFTNMSFDQKKPSEYFNEIADETNGLFTVLGPKSTKEVIQNVTIPSHIPLKHSIFNLAKREGFKFLVDKAGGLLVHSEYLQEKNLKKSQPEFYHYRVSKEKSFIRNQILEFQLSGFNDDALKIPDGKTSDITDKKTKQEEVDTKIYDTKAPSGGSLNGTQTKDLRKSSGTGYTTADQDPNKIAAAMSNLQQCSVVVPGHNVDRLYQIIEIELPLNSVYKQTASEETFTGSWMVVGYRDKIVSQYYTQELLLKRSGEV